MTWGRLTKKVKTNNTWGPIEKSSIGRLRKDKVQNEMLDKVQENPDKLIDETTQYSLSENSRDASFANDANTRNTRKQDLKNGSENSTERYIPIDDEKGTLRKAKLREEFQELYQKGDTDGMKRIIEQERVRKEKFNQQSINRKQHLRDR